MSFARYELEPLMELFIVALVSADEPAYRVAFVTVRNDSSDALHEMSRKSCPLASARGTSIGTLAYATHAARQVIAVQYEYSNK